MRSDDDHSPILDNSIFDYNPKGKSCKKLYNLLFLETGFWNKVCAAIQFEDGLICLSDPTGFYFSYISPYFYYM